MEQVAVITRRRRSEPCCVEVRSPVMSPSTTERVAERLRAVADATRLGMLDLLAQQEEPLCVCDITARFPQNQPTISHHLKILKDEGLVDTEKRGLWSYYWATAAGRRTLEAVIDVI